MVALCLCVLFDDMSTHERGRKGQAGVGSVRSTPGPHTAAEPGVNGPGIGCTHHVPLNQLTCKPVSIYNKFSSVSIDYIMVRSD